MTAPTYQVPHPAPGRPMTVTISSLLLYLVAAMQLAAAALVVSTIGPVTEVYQDIIDDAQSSDDVAAVFEFVLVATAVFYALIAIGLGVLAIFNSLGKNGSRVTTWVFAGLGLCCNAFSLTGSAASTLASGAADSSYQQAQIEQQLETTLPSWYEAVGLLTTGVTVLGLLGAIVLLALPASNAYFRKPAAWNPAMPYPPYQGQPGYPAQPGYPQPGYPQAGYPQAGYPQAGYPQAGYPQAQPGVPPQQPSYPQASYPSASYPPPASIPQSHFGSPEQYGRPGDPAPGLPPYPGQEQSAPEPGSDPWAAPPPVSSPPVSSPSVSSPSEPAAPPAAPAPPAENPWAPPRSDDPPQRPSGSD